MKYLYPLLTLVIFTLSCGDGQPFTGNKDNPLLVGTWTIIEIDNSDALANKELVIHALFSQHFQEGNQLHFEAGAGMRSTAKDSNGSASGKYEIRGQNETLLLKLEQSDEILEYKLVSEDNNTWRLLAKTVGDVTNLRIRRVAESSE